VGADTEETPARDARTGSVLLVEDNPDVANASTGLLEQLGYAVRWVPNAEAALREIEKNGFDLVVSDIVMPGKLDGLALAKAIKDKHPVLPILLTTGYSEAAHGAGGAFPILRKPYALHELSHAIAGLLQE
jgi:DNA-binding NtrC family response regulator